MKPIRFLIAAVLVTGCGKSTIALSDKPEEELIAEAEHGLSVRVKEHFGPDARVERVVPQGEAMVIGVATRPAPVEGDDTPPVGFAVYTPASDTLEVVAKDTSFREAKVIPGGVALVTDDGALVVQKDGAQQVLAENVRGDVAVHAETFALTLRGESRTDPETKVALLDAAGNLKTLADGEGVDDRPAISPDGRTVIFVSGRSGIASFYRTTTDGAEPVQLTNVGLEPGGAEEGEPAGFVPPPVTGERFEWLDADTLRYDAGGNELWTLNVRTGEARRVGGAQ